MEVKLFVTEVGVEGVVNLTPLFFFLASVSILQSSRLYALVLSTLSTVIPRQLQYDLYNFQNC
jgi:hypothetical protein